MPKELSCLKKEHILALRPFDVDCGKYDRMKYGYRKKKGIIGLTCSQQYIQEKIEKLSSQEDRAICTAAFQFLISNSLSSYKKFLDLRDDLVKLNKEPNIFDVYKWEGVVYKWEGVECALWPNLYPFTS